MLALFVLLLISVVSDGQGTNIKFKHISIKDGISQSTVNAITQDEMGFMWFGTQDGLNKFDGYDFTVYKHIVEDSGTITNSFINCFYNDPKGRLWVGTNNGISIFEHRLNRFVNSGSNYTSFLKLRNHEILCLSEGKDSSVWIGTNKALFHLSTNNSLTQIEIPEGNKRTLGNTRITGIISMDEDNVWIGTDGKGIFQYTYSTKSWSNISHLDTKIEVTGQNARKINALTKAKNGRIYIGTDFGLTIYNPKKKSFETHVFDADNIFGISSNFVSNIYEDHSGNIWVGTLNGGLNKFLPSQKIFYKYRKNVNIESSIISNDITSIFQDNSGVLWVGTKIGLSKFDLLKQNFNHLQFDQNSISSISRNIIWSILSDGDILWVGSNEGLNKYNRETDVNIAYTPMIVVNNEKRTNAIFSLCRDNANRLYVGTDGGVFQFDIKNNSFVPAYFNGFRVKNRTYSMVLDNKKRLWIGTRGSGLLVVSENRSNYVSLSVKQGLPSDIVRIIYMDQSGNIWLGTDNGLCKVIETDGKFSFKTYQYEPGKPTSLRNDKILSIAQDNHDFIWVGTFGGGLNRLDERTGEFISYTEKEGLPNNVIYGLLLDEKDNLWCSTNNGLAMFNTVTKSARNFDENDGLQSNEFNIGAFSKSEDGELFFGGIKGVNAFYPSSIQINNLPPHTVITDFQLFNKKVDVEEDGILSRSISVTNDITLSYSQNVFSFSFSALHYSLPERNRYAYKLEGFDDNWIFDDNTRRAKYTNLDPGNYVFKVKGTNSDGIWSNEASVRVNIEPPFWRIWWIQVLAALVLIGSIVFFYLNRLKTIQNQKLRLEREVEIQTIEVRDQKEEIEKQKLLLEGEKEKLETLLLNVLPESTVEELKVKGRATARNYNKVTVMFTDFKGFTSISESLTPTDLVAKLDSFFVKFDEIIEKYNIEKIKTIGDAYMCAGGIPIRNKSNPIDVVLAALDIQRVMLELNTEAKNKGENEWGLRLGIHTGIIIAGVIGIKRFAYDIWGDTVNVASRVETNGEVGKVNVSEATYQEIKDYFICEYRGKIYAKNKGDIDMYFVYGIKPYLSVDGKGIEPNETFWEYVNLNLFSPIKYHEAETHILNRLKKSLPKNLYYHNVNHTIDVTNAVERIALSEGVFNEDLFVLKMAALYHDAGFIEKYQNNESLGAMFARDDIAQFGFNKEQIDLIEQLIMITFAAKKPQTLLEKILRDADLDYLGRSDFHDLSDRLKRELLEREMIRSDEHWDELQVKFMSNHTYHTESARAAREESKQVHLKEIKARMKKNEKNNVVN